MNLPLMASVPAATQDVLEEKNDLGKFLISQIGPALYPTIPFVCLIIDQIYAVL